MDTYTILDWDDTLFPSSYLYGKYKDNILDASREEIYRDFIDIETVLYSFMEKVLSMSKRVVIITNSEYGWVQLTCQKFFPRLCSLIDKTLIISARDEWQKMYSVSSYMWKWKTFLNLFYKKTDIHIISIGDSEIEKCCAKKISVLNGYTYKTVKLSNRPSFETYKEQLKLCLEFYGETLFTKTREDFMYSNGEFVLENLYLYPQFSELFFQ